jgi:hypothetical protein
MPGLGRLTAPGAEYRVRGGTIFAGQLAVHGPLVPVVWHVAAVRIGEHFVQPGGPVVRAGRTKTHRRGALESFPRPRAGHSRRRSRLRDLVRSRAGRAATLGAGRAGADRKLSVPLVQIADSRVKFSRSPRPAGRAVRHPAGAFHILVVSQPGVFHKGDGRLTARSTPGGVRRAAGRVCRGAVWHQIQADTSTHSCALLPGIPMGLRTRARRARAAGWFVNRS